MIWRFSERLEILEDPGADFLKTLAYLGGYCSVGQAQRLGLAQSPTRASSHLRFLERSGFLRRVADYPVVYQVTKSVTRLLGHDLRARRRHGIETIRMRLLAVSFYLDALRWPAEFVFDPQQKMAVQRLRNYIASHYRENPDRLVFTNKRGRPYSANKLRARLHVLLKKLEIPHGSFHAWRHGTTSALFEIGAAPTVVQRQMRHSDPRITLGIYGHVVGDAQRRAVEQHADRIQQHASGVQLEPSAHIGAELSVTA